MKVPSPFAALAILGGCLLTPAYLGSSIRAHAHPAYWIPLAQAPGPPDAKAGAPGGVTAPPTADARPEVEIALLPSRSTLAAGDAWTIVGEVRNRSRDRAIWLVDTRALLVFPVDMWGASSTRGGLYGLFPTIDYWRYPTRIPQMIRVPPNARYPILWTLVEDATDLALRGPTRFRSDPITMLLNFTFFHPGRYRADVVVHVWYERPALTGDGPVNLDAAEVATASSDFEVEAPTIVLIFGAMLGGTLCWALRRSVGVAPTDAPALSTRWRFVVEPIAAMLLAVSATIVLSRLSGAEMPVSVKVRDFWGAIATGFAFQWLGYRWFAGVFPGDAARRTPPTASASDGPGGSSIPPHPAGHPQEP